MSRTAPMACGQTQHTLGSVPVEIGVCVLRDGSNCQLWTCWPFLCYLRDFLHAGAAPTVVHSLGCGIHEMRAPSQSAAWRIRQQAAASRAVQPPCRC